MSRWAVMTLILFPMLSVGADEGAARSAPVLGGVGAKIEALGKKARKAGDKAVGKTTKALKHAGKKTAEGLDTAGNKTSQVLKKATPR